MHRSRRHGPHPICEEPSICPPTTLIRGTLANVPDLGLILIYVGATGLIVALIVSYVRARRHPSVAPAQHRRQVVIGGVMGTLFVLSLILSERGSTVVLVAAAAVMVATNLDLLRRDRRLAAPRDETGV